MAPNEPKKRGSWGFTSSVAIIVVAYWFMNGNPTQQV